MRRLNLVFAATVTAALLVLASASSPPIAAAQGGSVSLFDGRSLEGWQRAAGPAEWTVEDGAITAVAAGGSSFLRSTREFANFELTLEFWAEEPGTNSGVYIRCPARGGISPRSCYEINISDAHPTYPTGSIVDLQASPPGATAGRWNTMAILADGAHLVVRLNQQVVADVRDDRHPSGAIALQAFGTGRVRFRNIQLRSLP